MTAPSGEGQLQPGREVTQFLVHRIGHRPVEGDVLMYRIDPQNSGFSVRRGVDFSDQSVIVQNGSAK